MESTYKRYFSPEEEEIINALTIEDLKLSVRASNALVAVKIYTVAELMQYSSFELTKIRNLGKKSSAEIKRALQERGLRFKSKSNE